MKRIWPAPTSYWDALEDVLHLFCLGHSHSHANSLATPFLLLPPPHFAVTRAGKLLSRGKVPAAQVSWPKAEACIHTTCSMPLIPMSTPAMAGYSLCSRRVKSVQVVLSCSSHRPPTDTSERQDARSQPCSSLQPRAPHCSICWWGKVGWHCCPPLFLLLLTPHYKDQWSEVLPEEQPLSLETKIQRMMTVTTIKLKWTLLITAGENWKLRNGCPCTHKAGLWQGKAPHSPRCCSTETALEPVLPSHTQHQEKQTPSPCKASVMHQPGYHFY